MNVFITGGTGWIGSVVVQDLISRGHQVTGIARSDEKATALTANGVLVIRAGLEDLGVLHRAAAEADAVIHTAFNHDFSKFSENVLQDRRVIEALGAALEGSNRPLLVTSGLAGIVTSGFATEADLPAAASLRKSEATARALAERGVRAATIRLAPSVHGLGDHGFIPILIRVARETGVSAYVDEGLNRWAGVHRSDAGRIYRLALEQGVTESVYHAIADEGVLFKDIAQVIGRQLGLPVESRGREHFGWFANFASGNMAASNKHTREVLNWKPTGPDLLSDLDQAGYYV